MIKKVLFITCVFAVFSSSVALYAQEQTPLLYNVNKVTSMQNNEVVHAYVLLDANPKLITNDYLTYAWFKSGKINYTQGFFYGRLLHGQYVSFYEDTTSVKENGEYNLGLKDGVWKCWYINGKLMQKETYKKGLLHGEYAKWAETGQLIANGYYKKGLKSGVFIYVVDGQKKVEKYRNGVLQPDKTKPVIKSKEKQTVTNPVPPIPERTKPLDTLVKKEKPIKVVTVRPPSDSVRRPLKKEMSQPKNIADSDVVVQTDTIQRSVKKNDSGKLIKTNNPKATKSPSKGVRKTVVTPKQ